MSERNQRILAFKQKGTCTSSEDKCVIDLVGEFARYTLRGGDFRIRQQDQTHGCRLREMESVD
jgi:hypothetical protein